MEFADGLYTRDTCHAPHADYAEYAEYAEYADWVATTATTETTATRARLVCTLNCLVYALYPTLDTSTLSLYTNSALAFEGVQWGVQGALKGRSLAPIGPL